MKKILFPFLILLLISASCSQQSKGLLNSYLSSKEALVSSDEQAAKTAISKMNESFKSDAKYSKNKELGAAIARLNEAGDLKSQRNAFALVSVLMWNATKENPKPSKPLYYQYCPMKDAYWISESSTIENPYYGDEMLECGVVKDVLK